MPSEAVIPMADVNARLASLGYAVVPEDEVALKYLSDKITNRIMLNTNAVEFPNELLQMAIDMICGEFLYGKFAMGQLTGYDFAGTVKRITEGDTTVEYAYGSGGDKTPEQRFVAYLDILRRPNQDMLASVRRLRW